MIHQNLTIAPRSVRVEGIVDPVKACTCKSSDTQQTEDRPIEQEPRTYVKTFCHTGWLRKRLLFDRSFSK